MKFNLALDGAILVTIITVFLYCSGYAYYNGYLGGLHITPSMLGFSSQNILLGGYLKSFYSIASLLIVIILYFEIVVVFKPMKLINWIDKKFLKIFPKKSTKLSLPLSTPNSSIEREQFYLNIFLNLIAIFVIYTGSIFYFAYLEKTAKAEVIEEFSKVGEALFIQTNDNKVLRFISCGESRCAGRDEKTKEIYFFEVTDMKILPKASKVKVAD